MDDSSHSEGLSDTERHQQLVGRIILLVFCATLLSLVGLLLTQLGTFQFFIIAAAAGFGLMYLLALWMNARGWTDAAANLYIWGTYFGQVGVLFGAHSFQTQAIVSYVNLVFCAGFMKGPRSALKVSAACLLAVFTSRMSTPVNWLSSLMPELPDEQIFVSVMCTLVATCGLTYLCIRYAVDAIERARVSQIRTEQALAALEVAVQVEGVRAAQAERLAILARSVVALREPRDIACEVARALSEECLGGAGVVMLDHRGRPLYSSGEGHTSESERVSIDLGPSSLMEGLSRRLTQSEILEMSKATGTEPAEAGQLVAAPDRSVAIVILGTEAQVVEHSESWQVSAASQLLATGIHRTHVEHALSQSQRMEALGRLAAGVAHDFNNLLTTILGGVDLARRHLAGDEQAENYIDGMAGAAERAAALSTKLMTFTASVSEGPRLVEMSKLLEGLLPVLSRSVEESIQLDVVLPEEEAWVLADPLDLERAILNLVINARDAQNGRGSIEIGVEFRGSSTTSDGPTSVVLWVEDNGPGIAPELRSKVFEPFFSTRESPNASGLGLSIVYGVVQAMGGEVILASELGSGTRIEMIVAQQPAGRPPIVESQTATSAKEEQCILVVEDDPDVRETISEMLRIGGYSVQAVSNGEEALVALDNGGAFALVLSDVVMPQMGGFELARKLRGRTSPPPLALVSGYAPTTPHNRVDATISMISKPFTLQRLLDFVGQHTV